MMNDSFFTEDSKRKGVITSILDKLGILEKFMLNHNGALHLNAPNRVLVIGGQFTSLVGGPNVFYALAGQPLAGSWYNNSHNDADSITFSALLRSGTYIFTTIGYTNIDCGKIDWYMDNSIIKSGEDWYSNPAVLNVEKTFTFTIPLTGYHVFKGVINGKNGASSNHYYELSYVHIKQSSD